MRVVKLLSGQELPVILDEVGVQPEEEGAVIIANRNPLGVAEEHKLGVPLYPWRGGEGHREQVSLLIIFTGTTLLVREPGLVHFLALGERRCINSHGEI